MEAKNLILIYTLCVQYQIDFSFIYSIGILDLIYIQTVVQRRYLSEEGITDLEKMIRIHQELEVNPEGIDVILNLLEKIQTLENELASTKVRLRRSGLTGE